MNLILLCWLLLRSTGYWRACFWRIGRNKPATCYARQPKSIAFTPQSSTSCTRKKPDWVNHEILRLKAHMGKAGCRKVAATFNRLHGGQATVSKSTVAHIIKHHQYQLACLIRDIRSQSPHTAKANATWGLDISYQRDSTTTQHNILGIIDHGSRLVIHLNILINKRAWTLLGHLCLAIGRYGKPSAVRTDNENIFNSVVFRTFLKLAGIKHQQTQICAPWQNGRIERLFGTLKPLLAQLIIPSSMALQTALSEFTLFYNHVRLHQNLNGLTPAETWQGITMTDVWKSKPTLVEVLDGLLVGFYMRR